VFIASKFAMGNVANVSIENQDESDQEFLQMQISAMFNDAFVNTIYDRLPVYDPKEKTKKKLNNEVEIVLGEDVRFKKLMAIFSHSKKTSCKVDDFEVLNALCCFVWFKYKVYLCLLCRYYRSIRIWRLLDLPYQIQNGASYF
jgi:hypothetical protein